MLERYYLIVYHLISKKIVKEDMYSDTLDSIYDYLNSLDDVSSYLLYDLKNKDGNFIIDEYSK